MTLDWNKVLSEFNRGNDLEATTNVAEIGFLESDLSDAWAKAVEIGNAFREPGKLVVLVEIWSDTGRIIFRMSDRREFARIVLNCPVLERQYYGLIDAEEFDRLYCELVDAVMTLLKLSMPSEFEVNGQGEIRVVARDSDDDETELELLP
jgi:hypothetical protein